MQKRDEAQELLSQQILDVQARKLTEDQKRRALWTLGVLAAVVLGFVLRLKGIHSPLLDHPGFMTFYRQATPIDALEHSRIGSRPSRRSGQPSLDDLRAIPWVFSWNQARFYVPGWYGARPLVNSWTSA